MTTLSGETVSGSKPPRYTPARIEDALTSLRSRIAKINRDSKAPYKIAEAVAFGDCLSDRARVQSADVGIQLAPRRPVSESLDSTKEHKAQREFLKQQLGKSSVLHIRPYEEWMSARAHRSLLT